MPTVLQEFEFLRALELGETHDFMNTAEPRKPPSQRREYKRVMNGLHVLNERYPKRHFVLNSIANGTKIQVTRIRTATEELPLERMPVKQPRQPSKRKPKAKPVDVLGYIDKKLEATLPGPSFGDLQKYIDARIAEATQHGKGEFIYLVPLGNDTKAATLHNDLDSAISLCSSLGVPRSRIMKVRQETEA